MKFMPKADSKKLAIIAENRDEQAWLTTTKNKSVRPGDEKYVIRAFNDWRRQPHDAEAILRKTAVNIAAQMMGGVSDHNLRQTEAHDQRLQNGEILAKATLLWQRVFHETPTWEVTPGGHFAGMYGNYASFVGQGDNPKAAKVDAAKKFLE